MINSTARSILAVDCGSVNTTAVLIEQIAEQYRLVATGQTPSTYDAPWQNITLGVTEAIRQIETATEREILAPGGWPMTPQSSNQRGVDLFVAVSSAGPPLRLALAGAIQHISLASARRAAAAIYTTLTNVLSLDAGQLASAEARLQAIQRANPDVILLVGGTDNGAEKPVLDIANVLAMSMRVMKDTVKPHVLYAGNSNLRERIASLLGSVTSLNAVDNIRPTLEVENLLPTQTALESLYIERRMSRLPGFQKLSNWTPQPILPVSKSFERVINYVGRHNRLNVIGVNVGSGSSMAAHYTQASQSVTLRSDAGVGHGLAALLRSMPVTRIQRWLPFEMTAAELFNYLLNKSLHPANIPTTTEELMIEYALAREAVRLVMAQARAGWSGQSSGSRADIAWNLLIGAGRTLTRAPHPGHAAMILLDGLEPWGVTSLALDIGGLTGLLGAIAAVQPVAAVEVASHDAFLNLGTVIAPWGHGSFGKTALKLKMESVASPSHKELPPVELEIPYGAIELIELPPGQKATLEIRPARHFDVGLGQPGRGAVTEVEGGFLGIIIDARGRPLRLVEDDAERHESLSNWLAILDSGYATARQNNQSE